MLAIGPILQSGERPILVAQIRLSTAIVRAAEERRCKGRKVSLVCGAMQAPATYTVGEMASRIARTGAADEVAAITRQLRNWTGLGLLNPIGERHEGTGRHRLYDHSQMMKAALLEALARNFQVDVTGLQAFAKKYDVFFPKLLIAEALTKEQYPLWMAFRDSKIVEHGFGSAPDISGALKDHEVLVVLDAGPIAKRIFA